MCCKLFIIGGLLYCTFQISRWWFFRLFLMGLIVTWKITILISKSKILVSGCNWYHNLLEVIYSGEGVRYGCYVFAWNVFTAFVVGFYVKDILQIHWLVLVSVFFCLSSEALWLTHLVCFLAFIFIQVNFWILNVLGLLLHTCRNLYGWGSLRICF